MRRIKKGGVEGDEEGARLVRTVGGVLESDILLSYHANAPTTDMPAASYVKEISLFGLDIQT